MFHSKRLVYQRASARNGDVDVADGKYLHMLAAHSTNQGINVSLCI